MIRAIYFPEMGSFERHKTPGSFRLEAYAPVIHQSSNYDRGVDGWRLKGQPSVPGLFDFIYFCPCGCGREGELLIGQEFKPGGDRPSWRWNGSRTEPTFDPSVNHKDHWHGWLRNGYWEVC